MAKSTAPDLTRVALRRIGADVPDAERNAIVYALPVDAREMVASKAYEIVEQATEFVPASSGMTAPNGSAMVVLRELVDGAPSDKTIRVWPIDAKEILAGGGYVRDGETVVNAGPPKPTPEAQASGNATAPVPEQTPLPAIEELEAFVATITDAVKLVEMEGRDDRPESKPIYDARFTELANESTRQ